MGYKKLKTNLHMASLTAIKFDKELKAYYERKVAEGKHKLSVLNAVKFKLLARVEYVQKTAEKKLCLSHRNQRRDIVVYSVLKLVF
jgi:hypothetical protein